ncbi:hypothetical protein Ccrd_010499 [Cynara cardunculus var. scolymus]|uniref:Uncharacterized protein n=1 Tax=Cynara cardunculus var. scolymus TaxID=59895 RepID=A0A103YL47_CYNCS|nr:hypothetical protein Ccrd_010499 [Cynara cardunculus var. scolymus]
MAKSSWPYPAFRILSQPNAESIRAWAPITDTGWFGANTSTTIRSFGLGRVMRQLAVIVRTYAQTTFDDVVWNLWPINASQAITSSSNVSLPSTIGVAEGSLTRFTPHLSDDDITNMFAMAETVREVLPHVPDELIF